MAVSGNRVPVSLIVPIRNEAGNLPRCLASITWADEIFVVDSQSTDGSIEIAETNGARVVQFKFNGTCRKRRIGRSRISRSGTNGSLFSTPTRCCRQRRRRDFPPRFAVLVR